MALRRSSETITYASSLGTAPATIPRRRGELAGCYRAASRLEEQLLHNKEPIMVESEATPLPGTPSKEELRLAMKAFRKRLKLTRLDDDPDGPRPHVLRPEVRNFCHYTSAPVSGGRLARIGETRKTQTRSWRTLFTRGTVSHPIVVRHNGAR